jgi:hypothetical protein
MEERTENTTPSNRNGDHDDRISPVADGGEGEPRIVDGDDADRSLSPELRKSSSARFGRRRNLVPVILLLLGRGCRRRAGVEISVFL